MASGAIEQSDQRASRCLGFCYHRWAGIIGQAVVMTNTILADQGTAVQDSGPDEQGGGNEISLQGTFWGDGNWANEQDWVQHQFDPD